MSLIKYPLDNAETFGTVAEVTLMIEKYFIEKAIEWNTIGILQQTSIVEQTFMYIMTCKGLKIPTDYNTQVEADFITSQAFLSASWINKDLFDVDMNSRAITKEKVGDLEVDYDPKYKTEGDAQHPYFYRMMAKYGCSDGGGGFSQSGTVKV